MSIPPPPPSVYLRRLQRDDIDEVIAIEREAFSPQWSSSPFKRDLNNKRACYLVACPEDAAPPDTPPPPGAGDAAGLDEAAAGLDDGVAPSASWLTRLAGRLGFGGGPADDVAPLPDAAVDAIAGYVSVWYQADEAHITEIAVRESLRGRGIGELLLIGSLRAAIEYGSHVMTLEARVSNFIAQRLYQKYSFKSVGLRKGYYSDNREDAVIMTTTPILTEEYRRLFNELQQTYESRWGPIRILD